MKYIPRTQIQDFQTLTLGFAYERHLNPDEVMGEYFTVAQAVAAYNVHLDRMHHQSVEGNIRGALFGLVRQGSIDRINQGRPMVYGITSAGIDQFRDATAHALLLSQTLLPEHVELALDLHSQQ